MQELREGLELRGCFHEEGTGSFGERLIGQTAVFNEVEGWRRGIGGCKSVPIGYSCWLWVELLGKLIALLPNGSAKRVWIGSDGCAPQDKRMRRMVVGSPGFHLWGEASAVGPPLYQIGVSGVLWKPIRVGRNTGELDVASRDLMKTQIK